MLKTLLDNFLCCPVDRSYPLKVEQGQWQDWELVSGVLRCDQCGTTYPVEDGIPLLSPPASFEDPEIAAAKKREAVARDADAEGYDATISPYQSEVELGALLGALKVQPGDIVLDLGAGTGRITKELALRGATVLAIDISPHSLSINRDNCGKVAGADVHFLTADVCHLPIRSEVANKVASAMMLEHVPTDVERRRCLDEIHRVLTARGKLALTAYNYSRSKRRHNDREGFHKGGLYYYRFDGKELGGMLGRYRARSITGILNAQSRIKNRTLDSLISKVPPVATQTGGLLLAVAER